MAKRQTSLDDERKESNELDRGNPQVLGGTVTNQYDVELLARLQLRDARINEIINKIRQRENLRRENRKRKEQLGLALAIGLLWVKAPHDKRMAEVKEAKDKAKEVNEKLIAEAKQALDKAKEAKLILLRKFVWWEG
jgi:hypothetical protein